MKKPFTDARLTMAGAVALAALAFSAGATGHAGAQERNAVMAPPAIAPHPSTQDAAHRTTFEEVVAMEKDLSNWGRWGKDDERGTLNS